ncbi:MAG: Trk system potassium transport protein TrkA [Spirochaetia bacterium]
MKIIIVGASNVGIQIARQLISENKDVVIIDRDPERIKLAQNSLDCMVVQGEANRWEVLNQSGVNEAEFFIAVTESDEMNLIACGMVSSEFKTPYKIARVRNFDYSASKIAGHTFLGINFVVNPEIEAAKAIVRSVEHGAISDIMFFEDSSFQMRSIVVSEGSFFSGKSVQEIKAQIQAEFIIAVIIRDNDYIIPSGGTFVITGDTLYLIASPDILDAMFSWAGKQRVDIRKIIIVGGGRIGTYVLQHLLDRHPNGKKRILGKLFGPFLNRQKRNIVLIDKDFEQCKLLAEEFPEILVQYGDISEEGFLEDGDLVNYDLLIATTGNQELNLVTSLYAKSLGIGRTVALVKKNNFMHIAQHLAVDTTISLNNSMVNSILKYLRRGNIKNIHAILGGKLEIIEASCEEGCTLVGQKIKDLKLPYDTLIIFISREKENIIPTGEVTIEYGDHIVLLTRKESIKKLDRIFAYQS